jgi:hypothetical protein
MPDLKEFISTKETAEKLKYHFEHMRYRVREGNIEDVKISRARMGKRAAQEGFR